MFSFLKKKKKELRSYYPVKRHKSRVHTSLVNYLPWDYYIKRPLRIDDETVLETCIVMQKNGSIQQTYAFRGHDIESYSEDYIAQVFEYFNSQIKRLGDGWMVSCEAQRYVMKDYPAGNFDVIAGLLVDREREEEFRNSGEHYDSCYYLTFVYKPEIEVKKKAVKFFFRQKETQLVITDEIKSFCRTVETITAVLSSRMIIRPLDCEETVCFLHSTCSTRRHPFVLPDHFLFLDSFIQDDHLDIAQTCRLGDKYIPILCINDFPLRTYPAILNALNKENIEYRWVSRFFPLSRAQALSELEKYQKDAASGKKSSKKLAGEMLFNYDSTLENHASSMDQSDVETAQSEVGGDVNGLGYYNSCVMVWDEDYDRAIRKMKDIQKTVETQGFTCREENYNSFEAFLGMVAGNTTANIRRPLISTGNFSHVLPFSAIWAGLESNHFMNEVTGCDRPLITCATDYGANFYLNLNDGDVGHTLILGPTGAGKSTLLNLIAASALKYPDVQVFFMDYGMSALTLTLACGGTYINPADSTVCFQPLRDIDKSDEYVWACDYIRMIIAIQGIEWEPEMGIAIEAAMTALASMPVHMRTITNFCLNLQYVDSRGRKILDEALDPYRIDGRFGKIFDGDVTSLSSARWVMFEMESIIDMGEQASAPALLFIFHFLESNFSGRLTFFIMDECWFGLQNPIIKSKMKEYLRTLRKKNVFCIFATQNPGAIISSGMADTMIQNCPTQIFLADPKAKKLADTYMALGLSEKELELLSYSQKKKDYYLKCPSGTRKFQLALGPLQLALFRGRETKLRLKDGRIVAWRDVLFFLMDEMKKYGRPRAMVAEILDMQSVPFRHYLEGLDWESYL